MIVGTTELDAERLRQAIEEILEQRATQGTPTAVPAPPGEWAASWHRLVASLPADADVNAGHRAAAAFLDPVLAGQLRVGK